MPTRMEELAAKSAQSPSEYEANKARNDAAAVAWRKSKEKDVAKQTRRVGTSYAVEPGYGTTGEVRKPGLPQYILQPVPAPVVVSEPPVDMVDYSLVPREMDIPWEQSPVSIAAIPAVIGTMMVMLGKRMLVSMAIGGLNYAFMEPLQQYGKGLPRARVLWHTGRATAGRKANEAFLPEAYMDPIPRREMGSRPESSGIVTATPHFGFSDTMQAGSDASEWLSEQIRGYFGFGGWLD